VVVSGGTVAPYRDDHLDRLLDVWYRASLIAHSFLTDDFFERERRAIAETWLPRAETLVYESDGRVVGFLSLIGDEVGALFVDPDRQRRGVGRSLMDAARSRRPLLEVSVFEANTIGRSFYESYGFVEFDRAKNDETDHPELRLRLDPA
jgi:putative acetyltransferase